MDRYTNYSDTILDLTESDVMFSAKSGTDGAKSEIAPCALSVCCRLL